MSAVGLEPAERRLRLSDGAELCYDRLLIATGGRPRTLPIVSGYDNVSVLRSLADARTLREALYAGVRLAVIGAGFIGLEVAATARRLGLEVALDRGGPVPAGLGARRAAGGLVRPPARGRRRGCARRGDG